MLFHLINRNPNKDITLHVFANNPAMVGPPSEPGCTPPRLSQILQALLVLSWKFLLWVSGSQWFGWKDEAVVATMSHLPPDSHAGVVVLVMARNATPMMPIDSYERAGAHND
jgi:hypothetical protein